MLLLLMTTVGMITACGKEQQAENVNDTGGLIQEDDKETGAADSGADMPENPQTDEIKSLFGENCISEQTFEVELSEYDGKVWFVSYAPGEDGQELAMQIVKDGEILTRLYPYVPESLEGQPFTSLDAVSFFDVNYDGYTDILLIETYGDCSFATVYYGFNADGSEYERSFISYDSFSEMISEHVGELTVSEIRKFLSDGKKNGEFKDYKEAYRAVARWSEAEYGSELTYGLIDVDDDDIPELVFGNQGYWVSLYTYHDGKVFMLMDHWAYGAMGNVGYEYIPKSNRLRNYNNDYAGLICYTTYMAINSQYSLENVMEIETYNFDDANGNGMPDDDEMDSAGYYGVSYVDGEEITDEQYADYDAGEYEYIVGSISLEELLGALTETDG